MEKIEKNNKIKNKTKNTHKKVEKIAEAGTRMRGISLCNK